MADPITTFRLGNAEKLIFYKEGHYNADLDGKYSGGSVVDNFVLNYENAEFKHDVSEIAIPQKTGTRVPQKREKYSGRKFSTLTVSGFVNNTNMTNLAYAFFMGDQSEHDESKDTHVYVLLDANLDVPISFEVHRRYSNETEDSIYPADTMKGAICTSLKIAMEDGGRWTYEAEFRGLPFVQEANVYVATAGGPAAYSTLVVPVGTPALAGNTGTCTIGLIAAGDISVEVSSWDITMSHSFISDTATFVNSNTRQREALMSPTLDATFNYLYDSASAKQIDDTDFYDQLAVGAVLSIANMVAHILVSCEGQITDMTKSDPDRDVYMVSGSMSISAASSSDTAIAIVTVD